MSKRLLDSKLFKKSILFIGVLFFSISAFSTINVTTPLPSSLTLCQGDSLMLSISATSDSALEYAWKRNGMPIGANSPNFNINSISISDTGTYTCEVKELNTSNVDIQTCYVGVNLKPVIVSNPTGGISPLCEGSTINLTANVQNATIVWKRNGTVLTTGSPNYTKTNLTIADTGNYYVLAKAAIGCRDTTTAAFYQDIKRAGYIISQPVGKALRDQANMSYVMRVVVGGDGPFAYQWYKDGVAVSGANSDSFKIFSYTNNLDSGAYRVEVYTTAPCADTILSSIALMSSTLCPLIISQPDTILNACLGGSISLEVKAVGVARYQWFKNSTDSLNGAIYSRYSVAKVDSTTAGYYNLITYQDSAAGTCDEKSFKRVLINVFPRPVIKMQPMGNQSCHAGSHTMTVVDTLGVTYQWYKNDSMIAGATSTSYTVNPVTMSPDIYKVYVKNPYCTPEISNSIMVRQVNPNSMVAIKRFDRDNLIEQCTDSNKWTYYAHPSNYQEMLFAIRKYRDTLKFTPSVRLTGGFIKELQPNAFEKKGILLGLRMFNLNLDSTQVIDTPYDVKFYYDKSTSEEGLFLSAINAKSIQTPFSTNLPTSELSFVVSTQENMDFPLLTRQSATPLNFDYTVVSDKSFGTENNISYVQINKLVASKGGGTFYFHYFQKNATGGTNTTQGNQSFSVFPNPSSGNITIQFNKQNSDNTSVSIYDYLGRELRTTILNNNLKSKELNYSDLPAGNYILRVDNGVEQVNSKLTISK